jgi:lysophospholipase L1-like esterase
MAYLKYVNTQGNADEEHLYGNRNMLPVAGHLGTLPGTSAAPPSALTVITDSVVLGAEKYFPAEFPGWDLAIRGKPAVMLHQIQDVYFSHGEHVPARVVLAIGYNSIWKRDRENFDAYAAKFDREAQSVLDLVRSRGAKEIVWVTLREPSPAAIVTAQQIDQQFRFGYYMPYVNERLEILAAANDDLVLSDWDVVGSPPGMTYDLIHLNKAGALVMVDSIARAVGE